MKSLHRVHREQVLELPRGCQCYCFSSPHHCGYMATMWIYREELDWSFAASNFSVNYLQKCIHSFLSRTFLEYSTLHLQNEVSKKINHFHCRTWFKVQEWSLQWDPMFLPGSPVHLVRKTNPVLHAKKLMDIQSKSRPVPQLIDRKWLSWEYMKNTYLKLNQCIV